MNRRFRHLRIGLDVGGYTHGADFSILGSQIRDYRCNGRTFFESCVVYSSRSVLAGSIPAMRRIGTIEAMRIADASVRTTMAMVGAS